MAKEIVVNAEKSQTRIAIVEDGDLAELYIENNEHERTIGNIVLGRVRKVMPSIRAAFVNIGQSSDAFLHFSDVADTLPEALDFLSMDAPDVSRVSLPGQDDDGSSGGGHKNSRRQRGRRFSPEKVLERGQHVLVKISKEPIADKGSRVSTDLSLAGRFLVLVPLTEFVAVSKKISNPKERRRLKALASSLLPKGFGAIVRTVAEGRDAKSLHTDLRLLLERWRGLEAKLKQKPKAPATLFEDVDMVSSIIRDEFSSDYRRILINNPKLYRSIRNYVQAVAPQTASSVLLHTDQTSVFEKAGIQNQVDRAFERRVELPSGGYLFIERTEAMHVIDVNSGRSGKGKSQEQNSLDVNIEAARVVARQTRLRDLGGILVVDFIDLRKRKNRKKVYDELKKEFSRDRAVTKILPMSDFGLVQITRQRLRPSITTTFSPESFPEHQDDDEVDERASSIANEADGAMSEARRDELQHLRREVRRLKDEMDQPHRQAERLKEDMRQTRHDKNTLETRARRLQEKADRYQKEAKKSKEEAKQLRDKVQGFSKDQERRLKEARQQLAEGVPPAELAGTLQAWVEDFAAAGTGRKVTLHLHPYAAAYLQRSVPSYPARWFMHHLVRVRIEADASLAPLDFRFEEPRTGRDLTEHPKAGAQPEAPSEAASEAASDSEAPSSEKKLPGLPSEQQHAEARPAPAGTPS